MSPLKLIISSLYWKLGNPGKGFPEIPDPKIKPLTHKDNLDNGRIKKASSWTPNALTSTKKFWSQLPQ